MNLIVAADKNWAIGNKGRLLVTIPEALPGRTNVVLTRNRDYKKKGVTAVHGMDEALSFLKQFPDDDIYIIGGEEIYRQFLPYCRTAHVTRIDYAYEADTHFPDLDQDPDWQESDEQTYFSLCYEFCRYDRKMEEKTYEKKE